MSEKLGLGLGLGNAEATAFLPRRPPLHGRTFGRESTVLLSDCSRPLLELLGLRGVIGVA
jgi:hypothetical protein